MPISPANMLLYPGGSIKSPEWQAIRSFIRARAGGCCEKRGVRNGVTGWRDFGGAFHTLSRGEEKMFGRRYFRIVCTVAHIDHDLSHNHESNLAFWCQRCHLTHDAHHHASNARATRAAKVGQGALL